jgi:aminoglycoside phosphotransferase (APT) family kinase protein
MIERTVTQCLDARLRRRKRAYRLLTPAEVEPALAAWLTQQLGERITIARFTRAPGGASKENFFFDAISASGTRSLLLRLDPGESIVETHRLREHQVLRAVEGALPAPRSLAVDAEGVHFGRSASILERVPGRTQPEVSTRPSGVGILFEPEITPRLADQFVAALASLHAIDWRRKDLSGFDAPRAGTTEAPQWSLDWWQRVWEEDRVEEQIVVELAADWLREHAPAADEIVIVHGDYRSGNFLYDASGITAILDWELAHLGDPHEDLGWVTNRPFSVRGPTPERLVCGLFTRDEFFARYEKASGRTIDRERVGYYEIFNNYKLAVMCQATALRIARGKNTHLSASMSLIHAFSILYVTELARALGLEGEAT